MKKLTIFLLLLSSSAWAGWKSIGEDDAGITYVDPAAVVRTGNTAKLWSMLDYKSFQRMVEVGYFSQKVQIEFDCAERKFRGLSVALHADHMGEGKAIYSDESPHEWEPVSADSMSEILWKIACQ
jgi:surface-adhesin protein E